MYNVNSSDNYSYSLHLLGCWQRFIKFVLFKQVAIFLLDMSTNSYIEEQTSEMDFDPVTVSFELLSLPTMKKLVVHNAYNFRRK